MAASPNSAGGIKKRVGEQKCVMQLDLLHIAIAQTIDMPL